MFQPFSAIDPAIRSPRRGVNICPVQVMGLVRKASDEQPLDMERVEEAPSGIASTRGNNLHELEPVLSSFSRTF